MCWLAGQPAGCESTIHAITEIFKQDETDGLLLIDAENRFNSLNRSVLLHNIQYVYPPISTKLLKVSIKAICYLWTRNSFCRRNNARRPADNAIVCYWYVIPN